MTTYHLDFSHVINAEGNNGLNSVPELQVAEMVQHIAHPEFCTLGHFHLQQTLAVLVLALWMQKNGPVSWMFVQKKNGLPLSYSGSQVSGSIITSSFWISSSQRVPTSNSLSVNLSSGRNKFSLLPPTGSLLWTWNFINSVIKFR